MLSFDASRVLGSMCNEMSEDAGVDLMAKSGWTLSPFSAYGSGKISMPSRLLLSEESILVWKVILYRTL